MSELDPIRRVKRTSDCYCKLTPDNQTLSMMTDATPNSASGFLPDVVASCSGINPQLQHQA
jgi:hypothetical protein